MLTEATAHPTTSGARGPVGLSVRNLEVVYDGALLVLRGVSLEVPAGAIVALLGANGAGKTTLLRAVSGLLRFHRGAITGGEVLLDGRRIDRLDGPRVVAAGLAQVMEGRRILAELTVEENLRLGGHCNRDGLGAGFDRVFGLFPVLVERRRARAGYLSGGEQQMLALGRALMSDPRLLLLDEPTLGLAPRLVDELAELIAEIHRQGTSILLVEQNTAMALRVADHGYVLDNGTVALDKPAAELSEDDDVREFYLGLRRSGEVASFREVKHYRRRKRWVS